MPASVIKYRFDDDTIGKLLAVDYSKINSEYIQKNLNEIYRHVIPIL